jgi:hypothetical protein
MMRKVVFALLALFGMALATTVIVPIANADTPMYEGNNN